MVLTPLLVCTQTIKKVAISEVVDREDNLSYGQKMILRSNMARAVANTAGYEAYDRTDIDVILGEQNFQRTGLVSDDQIKRLGVMTGAQYVLIIEAIVIESQKLFVTAKLLDVETGRIETSENEIMNNQANEILRGCQLIAKKVFKPIFTKSDMPSTYSDFQLHNGKIFCKNKKISVSKAESIILEEMKDIPNYWEISEYQQLKQSRQMIIAGWSLLGVGIASTTIGAYCYTSEPMADWLCFTFIGLGSASICTSVPLLSIGYKNGNKAISNIVGQPIVFNLTTGYNGLGIAMQF